jgi:toxin YoeB
MYEIRYTKQAIKDIELLKQSRLAQKAQNIINIIRENPFETPPPYEKLAGDLKGMYSRRINRVHRIVYKIDSIKTAIIIVRMWSHYE